MPVPESLQDAVTMALGAGEGRVVVTLTVEGGGQVRGTVPAPAFVHAVSEMLDATIVPAACLPALTEDAHGWLSTPDGRLVTRSRTTAEDLSRQVLESVAALLWATRNRPVRP